MGFCESFCIHLNLASLRVSYVTNSRVSDDAVCAYVITSVCGLPLCLPKPTPPKNTQFSANWRVWRPQKKTSWYVLSIRDTTTLAHQRIVVILNGLVIAGTILLYLFRQRISQQGIKFVWQTQQLVLSGIFYVMWNEWLRISTKMLTVLSHNQISSKDKATDRWEETKKTDTLTK